MRRVAGPDTRTTARAPTPRGVATAAMVSASDAASVVISELLVR